MFICFFLCMLDSSKILNFIQQFIYASQLVQRLVNKYISGVIWIVVVSEISKHKNNVIFKGSVIYVSKMFIFIHLKVWSWVTSKESSTFFSYSNWYHHVVCMRWLSDILDCWLVSLLFFFCCVCKSFVNCW